MTHIVIETSGKGETVDNIIVKLFNTIEEARTYCYENTDEVRGGKYWNYCEIIQEGDQYEMSRYMNSVRRKL